MIFCFDIDETICSRVNNSNYGEAKPFTKVIETINNLYEKGHEIIFMTARGSVSKIDHTKLTKAQLCEWGVKYHKLLMNIKPNANIFVDDKGMNMVDFTKKYVSKKVGFVGGCFDIIHPGYIKLFEEAKKHCNYLIVGLQESPVLDKEKKIKPTLCICERYNILNSIKYIDEIVIYKTENDLYNYLKTNKIDIRFLGSDYLEKKITGADLKIPIHFCSREHGWSTTKFKKLIYESVNNKVQLAKEAI
tara:strand:+ start:1338 stop:2078 length:741 start_codon:yes stop_codon:yes gene_type:complete